MTEKTFPTAEDIAIVEDDGDFYMKGKLISICVRDGFWYDKAESLKQQIIQDHVKAEIFDELLGSRFRNNSDVEYLKKGLLDDKKELIKNTEIVERLKEKINEVKRALEHLESNYPNDREEQKQLDWILLKNLKSILENK